MCTCIVYICFAQHLQFESHILFFEKKVAINLFSLVMSYLGCGSLSRPFTS